MGWQDDTYFYTYSTLEQIAECYRNVYEGIEFYSRNGLYYGLERNPLSLAEYKADFDMAWGKLPQPEKHSLTQYLNSEKNYRKPRRVLRMMRAILNGEE